MNVGASVTVTFPAEPVVPFAGSTVNAVVKHIRRSDYPYLVEWTDEHGTRLTRYVPHAWVRTRGVRQHSLL